ncbi:fasciclin domain-containing protein [Flavobacterium sp.]|uniref:fasciclin domain-containing protein n=1 Tax=Flavobacterium sp. TaxID=239 RepID=UPI002487E2BA|nr:fasciclin domain-containing protein [Flavobacterium sp.]MDI1316360.1 fasciclin domain-containing protein [Flavobacterium sp.]
MKNFIKSIALVALVFSAVSCSKDEAKDYGTVSIAKIIEISPEFSSLKEALDITGLTPTFEDAGSYTLFAPNNDAFDAVLGGLTVEEFNTANPGLLATVLKYHVVTSKVLSGALSDGQSVTTLQGQTFTVNIAAETGEVTITDANAGTAYITAFDVECTNGVIHPIDAVLLPGGGS